jgi:hypothetical protein
LMRIQRLSPCWRGVASIAKKSPSSKAPFHRCGNRDTEKLSIPLHLYSLLRTMVGCW